MAREPERGPKHPGLDAVSAQVARLPADRVAAPGVVPAQPFREFVTQLEASGMSGAYARVIFSNVRAILSAAVEDGYLRRNPCNRAR